MPPLTVMLKPVSSSCNLNCSYCFYNDVAANRLQPSYGHMTYDTLDVILSKSFSYASEWLTIAFQGGEPTLAGLDFYQKVIALVNQYNIKQLPIHYSIQTNGYLLTSEWASFFHDNHFLVGLSLDGIAQTHNAYRKDSLDKPTFDEVMRTVDSFNQYHVEYNILTVVTDAISSHIHEIYTFYRNRNFQFLQFIPCIQPFAASTDPPLLSSEAYGRFLCALFDLWYADLMVGKIISIRQFENYLMLLKGYPPESCDMTGHCSMQYIIEANGDVYPCDFYVLDAYKIGNIATESFDSLLTHPVSNLFLKQGSINHALCADCEYHLLCKGGCRRYRQMASSHEPHLYCEAYKTFFAHALDRMKVLCQMIR
ncbi:anaerobic sulfatase maturase [Fusibacter ferrireducens]|uniref:Anaerobic sulfatase maturase n=1 Tax=Fusibacter ferrireducens TaxID=2785058 RepID=A0ABR9ZVH9_9FIRM|nr:anaerobic sulfatase maturase [Fusibacter ferrireducens]MBF4694462.1 anaerobic sulfatase maturase [Fusibacter ferrireducens]